MPLRHLVDGVVAREEGSHLRRQLVQLVEQCLDLGVRQGLPYLDVNVFVAATLISIPARV